MRLAPRRAAADASDGAAAKGARAPPRPPSKELPDDDGDGGGSESDKFRAWYEAEYGEAPPPELVAKVAAGQL